MEGTDEGTKKVYIAALAVYLVFVLAFIGTYIVLNDDGDAMVSAMSVFALLFLVVSAGLAYYILVVIPKRRGPDEDLSDSAWEKK